ncbi:MULTISPECIES: DUF2269 family protein [Bradyrhizobium]|uniref:DUF2269 family protein n=1 Tax=Bradyrhizobium TaxID=374 RepID=UPI002ACDF849|nr:DUF2269 family protein [Bradyrhizobium sp. SEMIA]
MPAAYCRLFRSWFAFGFPAFAAVLAIFWLMIAHPATPSPREYPFDQASHVPVIGCRITAFTVNNLST